MEKVPSKLTAVGGAFGGPRPFGLRHQPMEPQNAPGGAGAAPPPSSGAAEKVPTLRGAGEGSIAVAVRATGVGRAIVI